MYDVEWIYFLLPIACLCVAPFYRRDKKMITTAIVLSFIVIYAFSLNGADIQGYAALYRLVASKATFDAVHGEIGFKCLMLVCNKLGVSYLAFRVCFISLCSLLFFYCAYRISPNFPLTVFFMLTLFVVYPISTYRQYMVMVLAVFWFYQYHKGRKVLPFIGLGAGTLFHISALFPLALLAAYAVFRNKKLLKTEKEMAWIALSSFAIRLLVYFVSHIGAIWSILSRLTNGYSDDVSLLSNGLLSRMVFLGVVSYLYLSKKPKNPFTVMLFNIYFIGICIYICLPYELLMGRLVNTVHFMLVLLLPLLLCGEGEALPLRSSAYVRGEKAILLDKAVFYGIFCLSFVILLNQLLKQSGYTPYCNILFGDKF